MSNLYTLDSRKKPFGLLVALDNQDGVADGQLFWDDGDSIGRHLLIVKKDYIRD